MALAVPVPLAVRLVVLLVVGDEVAQGEAVVAGHEVDRGERPPPVVLVQVGGAGQPGGELREGARLAPPQVPHAVPVLAVPLGPQRREVPHLVAALAHVPRLGDQLHLAHHRVLLHQVEEGREPVHLVELAGQGGRQVEAEAVHVHLGHPVPQAVHDHLEHVRGPHEQRVPGAGGVEVVRGRVVHEPVVRGVVQAPEGEGRAQVVALGGVVVDHVEDDLDARLVQGPDRRLELQDLLAPVAPGRVRVVRGEEADRVVAPVVREARVREPVVVHELVDGHQFERRHPQLLQVPDHRRVRQARVRAPQLLGEVRVQHRQALHVGLVDDRVVVLGARAPVVAPVEVRVDHDRGHRVRAGVEVVARVRLPERVAVHRLAPLDPPRHRARVGVEQQLRRVAAQPLLRGVRAVHPEPVPLSGHHARQIGVPHERVGLAQLHRRLRAVVVEQTQLDPVGGLREDREVGSRTVVGGAQGVRLSRPDLHGYDYSSSVRVLLDGLRPDPARKSGRLLGLRRVLPGDRRPEGDGGGNVCETTYRRSGERATRETPDGPPPESTSGSAASPRAGSAGRPRSTGGPRRRPGAQPL